MLALLAPAKATHARASAGTSAAPLASRAWMGNWGCLISGRGSKSSGARASRTFSSLFLFKGSFWVPCLEPQRNRDDFKQVPLFLVSLYTTPKKHTVTKQHPSHPTELFGLSPPDVARQISDLFNLHVS